VEALAYILARDRHDFLEIQEMLLLGIMECIESTGAQLLLPMPTTLVAASASDEVPLTPQKTG
jgi:hypothetical protein